MHKIDKFLAKLDAERREKILAVLLQIQSGNFENLDIKKLKDFSSTYRIRVGQCRIKFETSKTGINVIDIEFKSDNTYKR
jgi:mRNA-degrading endonuclease RelE of RelBE toxin-antitoxin system